MPVTASAPGKLVLTGEYAVLEGAPAVVLAVSRRARVHLRDSEDADWHIDAPDLGIRDARCRIDDAGRLEWLQLDEVESMRMALVARVLEAAHAEGKTIPAQVALDTQAFFASDRPGPQQTRAWLQCGIGGGLERCRVRPQPPWSTGSGRIADGALQGTGWTRQWLGRCHQPDRWRADLSLARTAALCNELRVA